MVSKPSVGFRVQDGLGRSTAGIFGIFRGLSVSFLITLPIHPRLDL
jgi:hypothetical protein